MAHSQADFHASGDFFFLYSMQIDFNFFFFAPLFIFIVSNEEQTDSLELKLMAQSNMYFLKFLPAVNFLFSSPRCPSQVIL